MPKKVKINTDIIKNIYILGGLRRITALKVMQAIVKCRGKAIVETASGSLISTYSAFSDSSFSGVNLITINNKGSVHVQKIKNAALIKMYQKHTIRSLFNASSNKIVIGSAGVSVTQVQFSSNSLQGVQQVILRRYQVYSGANDNEESTRTISGSAVASGGNAIVAGGDLKIVGGYGLGIPFRESGGNRTTQETVDESYEG